MTEDYGDLRADTDEAIREMDLIAASELWKRKITKGDPRYDDLHQEAVIAAWRAREARSATTTPAYWRQAVRWRIDTVLNPTKAPLGSEATGSVRNRPHLVPTSPLPAEQPGDHDAGNNDSQLDLLLGPELIDFTERAAMRGALVQAISELPPKQREYVVRRFWGGERPQELHLEFSHSTWERAAAQLRPRLKELLNA